MSSNQVLLKWIDKRNKQQLEWINQYLKKHAPFSYLNELNPTGFEIYFQDNSMPFPISVLISDKLKLFINKMRAAWRQKVFRSKKNGKRTYSFVMSTDIGKRLKTLAGEKNSIRETLEFIINERFDKELPYITELKEKTLKLQSKITEKGKDNLWIKEQNHKLYLKSNYQYDEIAKLKEEVKKLKQDKANLLNELKQLKIKHNNQFRNGNFE